MCLYLLSTSYLTLSFGNHIDPVTLNIQLSMFGQYASHKASLHYKNTDIQFWPVLGVLAPFVKLWISPNLPNMCFKSNCQNIE